MVSAFINKGHAIIIGGDWNDNLNNNTGQVRKMMQNIGLSELLITRYGKGPETYQSGTNTIDGIFATSGISIEQGGYTNHEESPGDHRWLWIDISEATLLERNRDDYAPPIERRATAKIPSVRLKFNDLLQAQVHLHDLYNKTIILFDAATKTKLLTREQEIQYEIIEERMKRGVKHADTNCRKVRRGKYRSPQKHRKS